jgi:hypothetical protein
VESKDTGCTFILWACEKVVFGGSCRTFNNFCGRRLSISLVDISRPDRSHLSHYEHFDEVKIIVIDNLHHIVRLKFGPPSSLYGSCVNPTVHQPVVAALDCS